MASSFRTPMGMGMFLHLHVPQPKTQGGPPVFGLIIVFDAAAQATDEYKALRAGCSAAIDAEFGAGKCRDRAFVATLRNPFRDALEKKQYSGFVAGSTFIAPWTKTKPGLVDGNLQDIHSPADVWAGQLVRATVAPFAYQKGANKGVNFMLNNVQIVKSDMPRMDGRTNASGDFDKVGGGSGAGPQDQDDDSEAPF